MHHIPVMPGQALEYLSIKPDGVYLDCTAGLGSHTALIAARLTTGLVIANDRDEESLNVAQERLAGFGERVRTQRGRFSELPVTLREQGIERIDGLLADLGASRYQLTEAERGFSLMADGPADMRMDRSQGVTAAELINSVNERELADLIYQLGGEGRSRRISRAIVRARPIRTTQQLANVVERAVSRTGRLHPATQTFMALRIAVNEEQPELDALLEHAPRLVKPGGRIVVIAFMSLEDRKVKQAFQGWGRSGRAVLLTKHVVRPTKEEVEGNPAARSARLRAAEILQ